jgi:hypothetical protein
MPNSIIVGRLRAIEAGSFILGGNLRVFFLPGVSIPECPLGTSLTVVAVSRQDVLYAESIRKTSPDGLAGP